MQLILHTPFGARINRAWGLALRKKFCRSFNLELQAAATDNGFVLSLSDQHAFPLDAVFEFVKSAERREHADSGACFPRRCSPRAGAGTRPGRWPMLRFSGGRKVPPQLLRMRADDLLAAVFPDQAACPENLTGPIRIPDHVLVRETIGNCLHEAMDIDGFLEVLRAVESGRCARSRSIRPNRRRFATRSSTPIPTRISTMRRWKSAAPAPLRCAGRLRDDMDGAGVLDRAAIAQVAADVVAGRARRRRAARRAHLARRPAAGCRVAGMVRRARRGAARDAAFGRRRERVGLRRAARGRTSRIWRRCRSARACGHRNRARLAGMRRPDDERADCRTS